MKHRGFTLVELLIVIVVIAILAAISVVAYNGIQQRAYASRAASAVDGAVKVLELYRAENGSYPTFTDTPSGYACFTAQGTLPATGPYAENECNAEYGDTISSELNTKLTNYVSRLPDGSLPSIDTGYGEQRAVLYYVYPNGQEAEILYAINGDYDCPKGEKDSWREGTTLCYVTLGADGGGGGGVAA